MNKPPLQPIGKRATEADPRAKQTIISMNLASGSIQEFDMDQSQLWSEQSEGRKASQRAGRDY